MSRNKIHNPTLVIGIGGTGKKGIQAIKRYIVENGAEGGLRENYPFLNFLSFDSSTNLLHNEANSKYDGLNEDEIKIQSSESIQLRSSLKRFDVKDFPELKDWFPEELGSFLGSGIFAQGCQQNRVLGRFLFAWNYYQVIEPVLRRVIDVNLDLEGGRQTGKNHNIFIIGSMSGGTGSGMFLDMAYAVRKVFYETLGDQRTPQIYGIIPGPSLFTKFGATEYVYANHYAGMLEIDYYMNLNHIHLSEDRFSMQYPGQQAGLGHPGKKTASTSKYLSEPHPAFRMKPLDYVFTFDDTNMQGKTIELSACMEMIGAYIANMYGGELAQEYFDINSNSSPELTKYAKDTGRPLSYSAMAISTILFPRNIILQRLSEYFTIQLVADLLSTELDPGLAREIYIKTVLKNNSDIYKWFLNTQQNQQPFKSILSEIDNIKTSMRNSLASLDPEDTDDQSYEQNITAGFFAKLRTLYDTHEASFKEQIISVFTEFILVTGKKLMSMDPDLGDGKGDISASILFYNEVMSHLVETKSKGMTKSTVFMRKQENEEPNFFMRLLNDLPVVGSSGSSRQKAWSDLLNNEINRIDSEFWELMVDEALGSESSRDRCIFREIQRMQSQAELIKKKFNDLMKNLVPEFDENKSDELKIILEMCNKPLSRTKPEGKQKYELVNYNTPPNPSHFILLWRDQDLHDFYHGNDSLRLKGVIPLEKSVNDQPVIVDTKSLQRKKRDVLKELLSEENLGTEFERVTKITTPRLKSVIIAAVRKLFTHQFFNWDIEKAMNASGKEGSLKDSEFTRILDTMIKETDIFLQVNDSYLQKAMVNNSEESNNMMSLIFLPNLYKERPCSGIKNSAEGKCPAKQDGDIQCDKLNACLKQAILDSASRKLSIVHPEPIETDDYDKGDFEWSQLHEIHILKVFHGVPLQAMEEQISMGVQEFEKIKDEGRRLLIARPRSDMSDEYYNINIHFPNEEKKEYLRNLLLLFAGGLLEFREKESAYRFVTARSLSRYEETRSSLDYDGKIELNKDLLLYVQDFEPFEGLKNNQAIIALEAMAKQVWTILKENRIKGARFNIYLRLVVLERDLTIIHPSRKLDGNQSEIDERNQREKDLIHHLLNKIDAMEAGLREKYQREGQELLSDININQPFVKI